MEVNKLGHGNIKETNAQNAPQVQQSKQAGQVSKTQNVESQPQASVVNGSSEKVQLSPEAQMAREAYSIAKGTPDVRADKVAQIKAAIKNGSYKVDPKQVADKMIQSSLEESLLETTES